MSLPIPPTTQGTESADHGEAAEAFEFWFDPGDATPEEIAEVFIALSEMHRAAGGTGLTYHMDGEHVIVAEAER